jgi:hypothetical protein
MLRLIEIKKSKPHGAGAENHAAAISQDAAGAEAKLFPEGCLDKWRSNRAVGCSPVPVSDRQSFTRFYVSERLSLMPHLLFAHAPAPIWSVYAARLSMPSQLFSALVHLND